MSRIIPVLFLLLLTSQVQASTFPIEIIEYIDDTKVVAFVYERDIQQSPTWDPATAAPPLEIGNLVKKLRAYAEQHPALGDASFAEVELKRIPRHPDHWHYLAVLHTPDDSNHALHYFVVLMDGKVIPALKEPAPLK